MTHISRRAHTLTALAFLVAGMSTPARSVAQSNTSAPDDGTTATDDAASADAAQVRPPVRSTVVGGHRFLLSRGFDTAFTTSTAVVEIGGGYARQEVLNPGPLPTLLRKNTFNLFAVGLGTSGQVGLTDWIALRLSLDALIYIGTGIIDAINSGATVAADASFGAVLGWNVGDVRLGVTTDVGYGYDYGFLPIRLIDDDPDSYSSGSVNSVAWVNNVVASWGVTPWLGLSARVLFAYDHAWNVTEELSPDLSMVITNRRTIDGVRIGGGLAVDIDLMAGVEWPFSLLLAYSPTHSTLLEATTHLMNFGFFYKKFGDVQYGLDVRYAFRETSLVTPERRNSILLATISLRYLW
ncbi:MAG: hypothetical protein DRJ42_19375 [Deltaproteobacteria bacterium]|nr:MAG: hypothetical protein DRJ42_19375 [Deltaproteobacteria bacterium]